MCTSQRIDKQNEKAKKKSLFYINLILYIYMPTGGIDWTSNKANADISDWFY